MTMAMASIESVRADLARVGQDHLLRFYDELPFDKRSALFEQIRAIDLKALPGLIDAYVRKKPAPTLPKSLAPAPYYPNDPANRAREWDRDAARREGERLIRAGKVAAFVVAGGQGSRLGYEGPKGCYPAGVVTNKPLFQFFAENLLGAKDRYGVDVPWYVMTSPLNHGATVAFFESRGYFGLRRADVKFFPQGVMPSLDIASGKVLLASKGEVATNPDGHGGCIRALHVSGALADMSRRGVEHVSYFQVDNPHVRVLDPVFIGLHAGAKDSSGEMSSKMVRKTSADEKVGVFVQADGRLEVLEYSDMPREIAEERDEAGGLRYAAGSIAIHLLSVEFLGRLATDARFALPFHRAEKRVACIDPETGRAISPASNNGVKLEKFVFDALALCRSSIVYETDRVEEFAPIKNATGVDSVESSKALQAERGARWLMSRGVAVPRGSDGAPSAVVEISPRTATEASELPASRLPTELAPGQRLAI